MVHAASLERMRVGICVESDWAGRAVARALGDAGAMPVRLEAAAIAARKLAGSSALVYDLNPWTEVTARCFPGLVRGLGGGPVLLYLPASGPAFTTFSQLPRAGDVRVQVQCRDPDSMAHLRDAAAGLIQAVPRVWIMNRLTQAVPGLSAAAYLFGHRALGVLASGRRPRVATIARALGLSQRTLQRRFTADGLPAPKRLLDWLTVAYLRRASHVQQRSEARVATDLGLVPNDLYRLRRRVLRRADLVGMERLMPRSPAPAPVTLERRTASPSCG
jgi:AraC-like DNA-binding protein